MASYFSLIFFSSSHFLLFFSFLFSPLMNSDFIVFQDFEKKEDLQKEVQKQLQKLEEDCKDALAVLASFQPGEDPTSHYKLQDLLSAIKTSRPKIQKSLTEETSEQKLGKIFPFDSVLSWRPGLFS
jgi:hypothetical protein